MDVGKQVTKMKLGFLTRKMLSKMSQFLRNSPYEVIREPFTQLRKVNINMKSCRDETNTNLIAPIQTVGKFNIFNK